MNSTQFNFDPVLHSYTLDGRTIASVTQVIKSVIPRSFTPDPYYLVKGSALHLAIHLLVQGKLDRKSVDERYKGKLDAFEKFQNDTGYRVEQSEIILASNLYRYAGTADAIMSNDSQRNVLVDFKSSLEATVRLQLGGYWQLLKENDICYPSFALALELKDDGNYHCLWLEKKELHTAWCQFQSCLSVYNFMSKYNLLPKDE